MSKKVKKHTSPKFDWEMLKLFSGIGIVSAGLGVLLFWATYTAPEGGGTESFALSTSQRVARMLPDDIKSKIAMVIAILFLLFGVFLIIAAIYRTFRFILFKK
ncbi:MAG: hypothetical protein AB9846_16545 [Tenuifilaceae bacterium]